MRLRVGMVGVTLFALAGCDGLLKVTNAGSIQEGQLADPSLEPFLVNGVIGEFQFAYGNYVFWSAALSDEAFADHSNPDFRALSSHDFNDQSAVNESVYNGLQRARQSADDAVERIRIMQGANAGSSINVARALVYGGYAYALLGEGFCEAPVNLSAALPSNELLTRAVARFDEGMVVATAASTGANVSVAQDLINLARVGAARASLKKGDLARARGYASLVPDGYERWAYYSGNSTRENNPLLLSTRTTQPFLGMITPFLGLDDARIPQPRTSRPSLNSNAIFPPLKPSMYSGWSATGVAANIDVATNIRFASGLEARYIAIEADGPNAAMLSFINSRRAVAGKLPVSLAGAALLAEFRVQRSIDFYLTGQRLGDLRRYAAAGTDLFPTGKIPVGVGSYGARRCFLIPLSEKAGNPNF